MRTVKVSREALRDICGCSVERRRTPDFLMRPIFRTNPDWGTKVGETTLQNGSKFLVMIRGGEIRYSTACPRATVVAEVYLESRALGMSHDQSVQRALKFHGDFDLVSRVTSLLSMYITSE